MERNKRKREGGRKKEKGKRVVLCVSCESLLLTIVTITQHVI